MFGAPPPAPCAPLPFCHPNMKKGRTRLHSLHNISAHLHVQSRRWRWHLCVRVCVCACARRFWGTHSSGRVSSFIFLCFTSGNNQLSPRPHAAVSSCFRALQQQRGGGGVRSRSRSRSRTRSGSPPLDSSIICCVLSPHLLHKPLFCCGSSSVTGAAHPQTRPPPPPSCLFFFFFFSHLLLFPLHRFLLLHRRPGLECVDRKWYAGVGDDDPGRAPSPPYSMLDSVRKRRRVTSQPEDRSHVLLPQININKINKCFKNKFLRLV